MGGAKKSLEGCKPVKNGFLEAIDHWDGKGPVPSHLHEAYLATQKALDLAEFWFEGQVIVNGVYDADLSNLSQVTPRELVVTQTRDNEYVLLKAYRCGATHSSFNTVNWNIHGNCSNKFTRTVRCVPPVDRHGKSPRKHVIYLDIHTRCRECERCLWHRSVLWRSRAVAETKQASRTWFGTLTLAADRQFHWQLVATKRARREGLDFDALPPGKKFQRVDREIYGELKKGIKRLAKALGYSAFKYIVVTEAHKSGLPHYHFLLHEANGRTVLYADLKRYLWREGFSSYRLVAEDENPTYLCKYLNKSLLARVRASQRYGCEQQPEPLNIESVSERENHDPKVRFDVRRSVF